MRWSSGVDELKIRLMSVSGKRLVSAVLGKFQFPQPDDGNAAKK